MTLKVGITGGIGSGKTIVTKVFSILGIPIFDADSAAKNIMNNDENVKQNIIEIFGSETYKNHLLNKKYLANIVFNDPQKLAVLNSIVHPATITAAENWMQIQTTKYAIKEAALIFETNASANLNYVIGVYASQNLRITRAMQRDNISKDEVIKRMNKQIDETIKMSLCDFIIINDEEQLIIPQILKIHYQLLNKSK